MRQSDAFVMRDLYGRHILMPVRANSASNDPIALNDVAADIWRAAEAQGDLAGVVAKVAEEYGLADGSPESAAVVAFARQLVEMGVLMEDGREG